LAREETQVSAKVILFLNLYSSSESTKDLASKWDAMPADLLPEREERLGSFWPRKRPEFQ